MRQIYAMEPLVEALQDPTSEAMQACWRFFPENAGKLEAAVREHAGQTGGGGLFLTTAGRDDAAQQAEMMGYIQPRICLLMEDRRWRCYGQVNADERCYYNPGWGMSPEHLNWIMDALWLSDDPPEILARRQIEALLPYLRLPSDSELRAACLRRRQVRLTLLTGEANAEIARRYLFFPQI